jgi:magnesium-transporting ATPase (P-type)
MSQGETEQAVGAAGRSVGWTLFAVLGGAIAWALHFLGGYAVVSIGCVARWSTTTEIVVVGTALLAALALWSTAVAWREWRRSSDGQPWDTALSEPRGWYSWLMTAGVLMGITSAFTIVLEGFGTLMLPLCGWNVR